MARRGRPKLHPIDRLKTKVWFALCANGRTPYWFNINVDNYDYVQHCQKNGEKIERKFIRGHKSKWEKYKHGSRTVDPKLVKSLAKMFPKSDDVFHSHIWSILKGKKVSVPQVIEEIQGTDDFPRKYILKDCYWNNTKTAVHAENIDLIIKRISQLSGFETLRTITLCLSWANEVGNHVFWNKLCDQYHGLLPELILDSTIPHRFQLFEALDEFALYRQFSSDTSRNDIRRSWQDQLGATKHYLINHYSIALRLHDSFFGWPELLFNQEDRRLLAKQMVEIIWENANHRYQSLEYWGPLGQLYAFVILNGLENDTRWKIEAPRLVISTLEDWNKEEEKEEKKFMRRHFKARQNPVFRSFSIDRNNQGDRMMLTHFS